MRSRGSHSSSTGITKGSDTKSFNIATFKRIQELDIASQSRLLQIYNRLNTILISRIALNLHSFELLNVYLTTLCVDYKLHMLNVMVEKRVA